MNYEEVINSIKSSLTDDVDSNINVLNDKINFYKYHRDGQQIVEELTKELNKYLELKNANKTSDENVLVDTIIEVNNSEINYVQNGDTKLEQPKEEETIPFVDYNNEGAASEKNSNEGALDVTEHIHNVTNALVTTDKLLELAKYCYEESNKLSKLIESDEEKNAPLKQEYQEYQYGNSFGNSFRIYIYRSNVNDVKVTSFQEFQNACNNGVVKKVYKLEIDLKLNYYTGNRLEKDYHENQFTIIFKPFDIVIERKSNHVESNMDLVEKNICDYIEGFDKVDTIFG